MSADEAGRIAADHPVVRLTGHFDPLLAEHARIIQAAAKPGSLLIVEITNSPAPLLNSRARAELVAALAAVDYVVISASVSSAPDAITQSFIEHVRERVNGARP